MALGAILKGQQRLTLSQAFTNEYDLVITDLSLFHGLWGEVIFKKDCLLGGSTIHLFSQIFLNVFLE